MRKVRHIIASNLPSFVYVFLVNDTKTVLRLLQKGEEGFLAEDAVEATAGCSRWGERRFFRQISFSQT